MLETAAPQEMQAHYNRAHSLRAQTFSGVFAAIKRFLFSLKQGIANVPRAPKAWQGIGDPT